MSDLQTSITRGLGLSQQEVAKLGGFGVVRESIKLFGGVHPSLVWIQFALVIPFTLYLIVDEYAQQSIIKAIFPNLQPPPSLPAPSWEDFANLDLEKWLGILLFTGLVILSFFLGLAIIAAVFSAVGSIYNGRTVTFSQVVHAVPHLWGGLFVTAIVNFLLGLSVIVVYIIFLVIFRFTVPSHLLPILAVIFAVIFAIPFFIIHLMLQVANGVTCFEDNYGITAFRKAKHILHNKWGSAVLLFILLAIPTKLVGLLIESPLRLTQEFHWRWFVLTIFYVIFTSYLTELIWISWAVFYFSCAANYEQDESIHQQDQLESGYQPLAPALA